jgi:hypothetical protein
MSFVIYIEYNKKEHEIEKLKNNEWRKYQQKFIVENMILE